MRAHAAAVGFAALVASAHAHARPDDPGPGELFTFDDGDVVETHATTNFVVHFTREGTHAVPAADDDTSGIPDAVEQIGQIYEDVLAHFVGLGFRAPLSDEAEAENGGDGRFDVYLVDFGLSADGTFAAESCGGTTCIGYMVQENDFAGYGYPSRSYANRLLASHEFFHAIQAAYHTGQGGAFSEGTATWATESFDSSLDDLEGYGAYYLDQTDNSIDFAGSGPVDPFIYGTGIFYDWLAREYGVELLVDLLEAVADDVDGYWLEALDSGEHTGGDDLEAVLSGFARAMLIERGELLKTDEEALPAYLPSFRSFVASFRTVCAMRGGRSDVVVEALDGSLGDDDARVHAQLFALDGDSIVSEASVSLVAGERDLVLEGIDDAAQRVCLQVVNARLRGDGSRPYLCVGSPDEVDDCVAENGGGNEGEGEGEGEDDEPSGCACAAASPTDAAALGAFFILLSRTRRRQKRSST